MSQETMIFHCANNLPVAQRNSDGYVNATALCKAAKKQFNGWYRLESTTEYLQALASDTQISVSELVQVRKGGNPTEQGTWVHPEVAIDLAKWISPEFRVLVNRWVMHWMTSGQSPKLESQTEEAQVLEIVSDLLDQKLAAFSDRLKAEIVQSLKTEIIHALRQDLEALKTELLQALATRPPEHQKALPQNITPHSIKSASELPEDLQKQNRAETFYATQPGSRTYNNLNSAARIIQRMDQSQP